VSLIQRLAHRGAPGDGIIFVKTASQAHPGCAWGFVGIWPRGRVLLTTVGTGISVRIEDLGSL
jgi:hypothetical protein